MTRPNSDRLQSSEQVDDARRAGRTRLQNAPCRHGSRPYNGFSEPRRSHRASSRGHGATTATNEHEAIRNGSTKGAWLFEQAFKNIDDVLRKDAGSSSELDYVEQTSWLLFLKYLDALEQDRAMEAALEGRAYDFILAAPYRWATWAAPKTADGKLDYNNALTGDDLREFVDQKLFPYLRGFTQRATGPNTVEYKVGEIFGEIKSKFQSGYNLREVIDIIDGLRFRSQTEKHELSYLYEAKIRNMGNAGRNGGEYYTPRPLIRAMIKVVDPKIGERIYDGAVGSAGFLCESFEYLSAKPGLTTSDLKTLQERTFYGKEKKSLAYVIAIMNMILHGIDAPNVLHVNTLAENLADIEAKDRYDVVLANPPFGGKERNEVQQNFPIKTGETAYLFLQHFIRIVKAGGRAGIVIKNTFLSNTDNASVSLRKLLLEGCNLHTVLDLPSGAFQGAGVKTVVLFFEKGAPTRTVWYYQLQPGRNMGKTNPLNDHDLAEFVELQKTFADSSRSWSVDIASVDTATFDLSVRNPDGGEEVAHRSPQEVLDEIAALDAESAEVLSAIRALL
jgi:type I restriction enzyme M protein